MKIGLIIYMIRGCVIFIKETSLKPIICLVIGLFICTLFIVPLVRYIIYSSFKQVSLETCYFSFSKYLLIAFIYSVRRRSPDQVQGCPCGGTTEWGRCGISY